MTDNSALLSFDQDGVQWAWDATSEKEADTCLRKYQLRILEGWTRPDLSIHLWFGAIYASSLEYYYKLRAQGTDREDAIRAVVRHALIESWDHDRAPDGSRIPGTGKAHHSDHQSKSRETLIRTIIWYFEFFKEDHFQTLVRADGTPAVENSFSLHVDNDITLCGHMDRVVTDPDGNIFVQDQKTTGQTIGPYYWNQFKPDIQFAQYTFAGKAVLNTPVRGVIVDAAQIAVGFSRYARAPVLFTDGELNEWYDETLGLIERTQRATRNREFPRTPASCGNYGGCVFRPVCSRPPQVRDNFLAADFVRAERWDPLKRR